MKGVISGYTEGMPNSLSRREFLKLSWLSFGGLAFTPLDQRLPEEDRVRLEAIKVARVASHEEAIRREPSLRSPVVGTRRRDELVRVYEEIVSPSGPEHNPRWYRVIGGFMHTARLVPVETRYNPVVSSIRAGGEVFRVTVPFTQSLRYTQSQGWTRLYRLYYLSNHWVMDVTEGPDKRPWYVIVDDLLKVEYMVPAAHLQRIPPQEFEPISPDVTNKYIEVSLKEQTVTCYENGEVVMHTDVSTGIPSQGPTSNGIPTETPAGEFRVSLKTPVRHMGDGALTSDIFAYELPGVPWTTFFTETGVAFHGTYWHDNYGTRMSSGCVNMRPAEAHWLYRWTTPVDPYEPGKWHINGYGTLIRVF